MTMSAESCTRAFICYGHVVGTNLRHVTSNIIFTGAVPVCDMNQISNTEGIFIGFVSYIFLLSLPYGRRAGDFKLKFHTSSFLSNFL